MGTDNFGPCKGTSGCGPSSYDVNVNNAGGKNHGKEPGIDDEDFYIDEDYNISSDDEDFLEVVGDKFRGRPRVLPSNMAFGRQSRIEIPNSEYIADSEYEDDEDLYSDASSEEEEWASTKELAAMKKKSRDPEFNFEREGYNPSFVVGMRFANFTEFKKAAKNWGIKNRRQIYFPTNDKLRCSVRCYSEKKTKKKCSFYIWASKVGRDDPTVQIKTLRLQHTCAMVFNNFHMDAEWLAQFYLDRFRADPTWHEDGFVATVLADHGYKISHTKAWRVRSKCLKWIYGEEHEQYAKLIAYGLDLKNTNPGSTVMLWREFEHFRGFYICLSALKEAFKRFLRPIICVDGCWLKGTYGGQLLAAVGIDPNDCIFPIAWAVVQVENRETWTWFLSLLGEDLEIYNNHRISFMSDRQKGLVGAIKSLYPNAEHRNCVRHMYTNFRGMYKGKEFKDLVWNAAKASYPERFEKCMEKIEEKDKEAREWFNHPDRPMHSWSRAFFREPAKCDILLNNLCECFNSYILDTRRKPIITMLEMIKNRIMKRLHTKKTMAARWNQSICPKVAKKLEKANMFSTLYIPIHNGHTKFRLDGGDGPHICDLDMKTCTCRKWQLNGLPCSHALCAIRFNGDDLEEYVDDCYKVETYRQVYSLFINPTNNEVFWPADPNSGKVIPPPKVKPKRGRPTTKRRKDAEELKLSAFQKKLENARTRMSGIEDQSVEKISKKGKSGITCSFCRCTGHNKRYCPQRRGEPESNVGHVDEDNVDNTHQFQENEDGEASCDEACGVVTQDI